VFVIYGSLGLFWNAAWNKYVADYPPLAAPLSKTLLASSTAALQLPQQQQQQDSSLQQQQQQQGLSLQQPQQSLAQQQPQPSQAAGRLPPLPRVRDLPWKQFFTNRAFLAIVMAHSAFGVGHYVCLSWLPTYYSQEFDVDVQQSALLSVLPWWVLGRGWGLEGVCLGGCPLTIVREGMAACGGVQKNLPPCAAEGVLAQEGDQPLL
jgi:hypothetical protein